MHAQLEARRPGLASRRRHVLPARADSRSSSRLRGQSMQDSEEMSGIRAKGEEAVGELAQALLENPVFNSALARALGAGERAMAAQRSAMGALNVASGSDVERLEQRLRSLSARLEAIEDRVDEIAGEVFALARRAGSDPGAESSPQSRLADSEAEV